MAGEHTSKRVHRREFIRRSLRGTAALALGGLGGLSLMRADAGTKLWQIDPFKCAQCGRCATHCVLEPSAVKCVHTYERCGYCKLCFAFFQPGSSLTTGAENQVCPTGAIKRTFVEEPFFEYTIDEPLCIGCAKCVKGCNTFGNGSLFLQIRHDRCQNCNECSIARSCPSKAISRVSEADPYLLKGRHAAQAEEEG